MAIFHKLVINNITKETSDAVCIEFDISKNPINKEFTFTAGQYVTLKTTIDNQEVRRAYSICSSPNSNRLQVIIKAIENGIFSNMANERLKVGDTLDVAPPEGNFILKTNPVVSNTYAAFVAGSGITPVMSMIKAVLEKEPKSKFVLVYGNQTFDKTILAKELDLIQQKHKNRLFIEYIFSRKKEEIGKFGRIDTSIVNYVLKNKYKDVLFSSFFICGPEAMIHTVKNTLSESKIPEENIHFELFTSSIKPLTNEEANGSSTVKLHLDDESFEFTMEQKITILQAALDNDIDAPYSCKGGVCSSCICRLKEGAADMGENNSILTDEEVEEGLVLACVAHPTTPSVIVDFDDV